MTRSHVVDVSSLETLPSFFHVWNYLLRHFQERQNGELFVETVQQNRIALDIITPQEKMGDTISERNSNSKVDALVDALEQMTTFLKEKNIRNQSIKLPEKVCFCSHDRYREFVTRLTDILYLLYS